MDDESAPRAERILDAESLKALAHPLRVEIFDALSAFGPATASQLAERLGESSGATSYHLRQLERHGFVEDDPDRGTARERWWRRVRGSVALRTNEVETPAAKQIAESLAMQWHRRRQRELDEFLLHSDENFSESWLLSTTISSTYLRLTKEELGEIVQDYNRALDELVATYRDRPRTPEMESVLLNFNAFPVPDRAGTGSPASRPDVSSPHEQSRQEQSQHEQSPHEEEQP